MKSTIKVLLAFAGLLAIPAIQAMQQDPIANFHVKNFSTFVDEINQVKIEAEAALVTEALLHTKNPDAIKKQYDKISNSIIKEKIGNPTIVTLDHLAKKDAWEKQLYTTSTQEQAELIALKSCTLRNEPIVLGLKKAHQEGLKPITDSMQREKEAAKEAWRQQDKTHRSLQNLKEQSILATRRAKYLHVITKKYDEKMHHITGQHVQRLLTPARLNQPTQIRPPISRQTHLTPAVDALD